MTITTKTNGKFGVDIKTAGRKRFRKTYDTHKEAVEAERVYLGGGTPATAARQVEAVTLKTLYDNALRSTHCDWSSTSKQAENAVIAMRYFGEDRKADSITDKCVMDFVDYCASDLNNSKSTINKKLSALSVMYDYGKKHHLVNKAPDCSHLKIKKAERNTRINYLKREDEEKFLYVVETFCGEDWKRYMICLIETGCRTGEMGYMTIDCVDWDRKTLSIYPDGDRKVKAGARVIPLTERALEAIRTQEMCNAKSEQRLFPMFTQNILNKTIWARIREALNRFDKDFVPHMLRHTCATRLVELGANIVAVKKWMGHESLQTTLGYIHMSDEGLDDAVERLNKTRHATRHVMAGGVTVSRDVNEINSLEFF